MGNFWKKISVLNELLKVSSEGDEVTDGLRLFQASATATGKARPPMVELEKQR